MLAASTLIHRLRRRIMVPSSGKPKSIVHPSSVPCPTQIKENRAGNATGAPVDMLSLTSTLIQPRSTTYCQHPRTHMGRRSDMYSQSKTTRTTGTARHPQEKMKKLLTEHTPSFASSQIQIQKMICDGSVMVKPLLCTLCTLTSSTCAEQKRSLPEMLNHDKPRNSAGKDCAFGGRTWNATDTGKTSAMLLEVLSRFISVTTFPSQMNRMKCSLLRSIVTAIAICCHSWSRAIISNSTMLSSPFSTTETSE